MPAKAKNTNSAKRLNDVEWGGYINLRMGENDKTDYGQWVSDQGGNLWSLFVDQLALGMKFSLTFDKENNCFIATFTGHGEELIGIVDRCAMSARAPEWEQSIYVLLYKHLVMLGSDWGRFRVGSGTIDNFG